MQLGDVPVTFADTSALERDSGFKPSTSLRDGLRAFAEWYAGYYGGICFAWQTEKLLLHTIPMALELQNKGELPSE